MSILCGGLLKDFVIALSLLIIIIFVLTYIESLIREKIIKKS